MSLRTTATEEHTRKQQWAVESRNDQESLVNYMQWITSIWKGLGSDGVQIAEIHFHAVLDEAVLAVEPFFVHERFHAEPLVGRQPMHPVNLANLQYILIHFSNIFNIL